MLRSELTGSVEIQSGLSVLTVGNGEDAHISVAEEGEDGMDNVKEVEVEVEMKLEAEVVKMEIENREQEKMEEESERRENCCEEKIEAAANINTTINTIANTHNTNSNTNINTNTNTNTNTSTDTNTNISTDTNTNSNIKTFNKVHSDVFEALIAAIFLDQGFHPVYHDTNPLDSSSRNASAQTLGTHAYSDMCTCDACTSACTCGLDIRNNFLHKFLIRKKAGFMSTMDEREIRKWVDPKGWYQNMVQTAYPNTMPVYKV